MVFSTFNIVSDSISDHGPNLNIDIVQIEDRGILCDNNNTNVARLSASMTSFLSITSDNGVKIFNIFLSVRRTNIFLTVIPGLFNRK